MKKIKVLNTEEIERITAGMYHGIIIWMKDGKVYTCASDIRIDPDSYIITGTFTLNKELMEQFS